jgi:uncharacterized membrane protein
MSARGVFVVGLGKTRIEALTDGIFGAVMTILGLTLTVPLITGPPDQPLPDFGTVLAGVLIYALSFVTLAVFWVGHHIFFHYVRRTDRTLIWLNNFFLLFVGLVPLTTALLGRHDLEQVTIVVYGLNLIAVQLFLYSTFWYATVHHHLVDADLDQRVIRSGRRRILLGPCLSTAAILLSFVNPLLSLGVYMLFPVLYIFPGRIDWFWLRQELT